MKKILLAAALATTLFGTSCLGPDNAYHNLHNWNEKVTDSKWANEGIFFVIQPVYGLFLFGDYLIFNSIQFWTGDNPISPCKG